MRHLNSFKQNFSQAPKLYSRKNIEDQIVNYQHNSIDLDTVLKDCDRYKIFVYEGHGSAIDFSWLNFVWVFDTVCKARICLDKDAVNTYVKENFNINNLETFI